MPFTNRRRSQAADHNMNARAAITMMVAVGAGGMPGGSMRDTNAIASTPDEKPESQSSISVNPY
jgi:hypothetical protein